MSLFTRFVRLKGIKGASTGLNVDVGVAVAVQPPGSTNKHFGVIFRFSRGENELKVSKRH
jgi:hypothetical protein